MTQNSWDYIYQESFDVLKNSDTEEKECVSLIQPMPFSHLQIALFTKNDKYALVLKDDPSSRKLCTMDRRRKDILAFEMIHSNLLLVKLMGDKGPYWTMMDSDGYIQSIPEEMKKILTVKAMDWSEV